MSFEFTDPAIAGLRENADEIVRTRCEPYAQHSRINGRLLRSLPADEVEQLFETATVLAKTRLDEYMRLHHLRPATEIRVQCSDAHADAFIRDETAVLVERRAFGVPPEQRLPRGWRAFFKAP